MPNFLRFYKFASEKKEEKEPTSGGVVNMLGSHIAGEALGLTAGVGSLMGLYKQLKGVRKLTDEDAERLLKKTKLKDKVYLYKPNSGTPRIIPNAWYDRRPYKDHSGDKVKKYRKGSVHANSKLMWKPGVIAHEFGHADIENNPGFVRFLQRHVYGPTKAINSKTFGLLPTLASFKMNQDEDDSLKGFLRGGLIGATANAGTLIPEMEASRRGIKQLLKLDLNRRRKLMNALTLLPAFGTYLSGAALPSAVVGGIRAHKNKKIKENKKKKEKTKEAEFLSKVARIIKSSGSDIDIMFDKKVETDPKNPFDGRLKKNKPIVEVKEKELETPKLHTHKVKIAIERLKGGLGDNKKDESFSSSELRKGTSHELEHTKNKEQAKEIAKDHLSEVKDYYSKLEKADIE
jgi:hypothetical protein